MLHFIKRLFNRENITWGKIIPILERGDMVELDLLLWRRNGSPQNFLPITFRMLQKLAKPANSESGLTVYNTITNGKFLLIFFETPWSEDDIKCSPLIIDTSNDKIVGIMLPFNELHGHLTKSESSKIGSLGVEWTKWIFTKRFS